MSKETASGRVFLATTFEVLRQGMHSRVYRYLVYSIVYFIDSRPTRCYPLLALLSLSENRRGHSDRSGVRSSASAAEGFRGRSVNCRGATKSEDLLLSSFSIHTLRECRGSLLPRQNGAFHGRQILLQRVFLNNSFFYKCRCIMSKDVSSD
jgi:hypothetical protein